MMSKRPQLPAKPALLRRLRAVVAVGEDATGASERDALSACGANHDRLDQGSAHALFGDPFDEEARRDAPAGIALGHKELGRGHRSDAQRFFKVVADELPV